MINDFIFYSRVEYYQKSYFMSKALLSALDSIMHTFLAMSASTHALLCWKLRGGWRFPVIQHFLQINVKITAMAKLEINGNLFKHNCISIRTKFKVTVMQFLLLVWLDKKKKGFIHNIKICVYHTQQIKCHIFIWILIAWENNMFPTEQYGDHKPRWS